MIKKAPFLLFAICYLLSGICVYAQNVNPPWWLSLEQGKQQYRNGDYGRALLSFEDARRHRREKYEQMERDLINMLSDNNVRRLGDSLEIIEKYAQDRYYTAAYNALQELFYRVPRDSLNNSALAALDAIGKLKDYPEAEYWIGEVYRIEGELNLALMQFRKAWEMRDLFENPGFAVELQYKIAGVLMVRQDYNDMIRMYHSIINELDSLWTNAAAGATARIQPVSSDARHPVPVPHAQAQASFATQAMARTLDNEGINRFMELFRYNNSSVENAHRRLGFFYAQTGRPVAQQHLMFAFLIQNTIIIDEVTRRRFDFAFTNFQDLMVQAAEIPLLLSYIDDVEYYKTVYYLGVSLYRNGRDSVSRSLFEFLATQPQAGEWYNRSLIQLRTPFLEPIVEMP